MTKYLLPVSRKYPHIILAGLGSFLGILIIVIDKFLPAKFHVDIYILLTIILLVHGLLMGFIIRKLSLNFYQDTLTGLGNRGMFNLSLKLEMGKIHGLLTLLLGGAVKSSRLLCPVQICKEPAPFWN